MKMLACQLNNIGWLQMNAAFLKGQDCIQAEAGSTITLHINERCSADKMQINPSSGQKSHSKKKSCSLLETHHISCLHSPKCLSFLKKISTKRLVKWIKHCHKKEDFDLSKELSTYIIKDRIISNQFCMM